MPTLFLTSSPFREGYPELSDANGFLGRLFRHLPDPAHGLFIASNPADCVGTECAGMEMKEALGEAGANIISWQVLHDGTADRAAELVGSADLIILSGGHVPTQNAFFQRIGLRGLLQGWDGTIISISAGSMNCASMVYSLPEEPGEAVDPFYHRFFPGLGLTDISIIPHFQKLREVWLDGYHSINDLAVGDSFGHTFYCLPDGSYIYKKGTREELHGPASVIQGGLLRIANHPGEVLLLHE